MTDEISHLISLCAAIAAIITAAIAIYRSYRTEALADLAIARVSSSRLSRLSDVAKARASSCCLSQTRENLILSSGTACEPESIIRTPSSPSDSNSDRHAACLGSTVAMEAPNAVRERRAEAARSADVASPTPRAC